MKNKLILTSSALLVIIFGLLFLQKKNTSIQPSLSESSSTPQTQNVENTVSVVIDYGNNKRVENEYPLTDNDSAFSVLEKITLDNTISLETEQYDFGIFVKSINGLESGVEMSWIYFVNGESGQVAADQMVLNPGDDVEWKYIAPSENDQ